MLLMHKHNLLPVCSRQLFPQEQQNIYILCHTNILISSQKLHINHLCMPRERAGQLIGNIFLFHARHSLSPTPRTTPPPIYPATGTLTLRQLRTLAPTHAKPTLRYCIIIFWSFTCNKKLCKLNTKPWSTVQNTLHTHIQTSPDLIPLYTDSSTCSCCFVILLTATRFDCTQYFWLSSQKTGMGKWCA